MKRIGDVIASLAGLLVSSPIVLPTMVAVWLQDYKSPFYIAPRVGRQGRIFRMVKLRSMVVDADRSGVDSTSASDPRITAVGRFIRAYKLDELTQLWNVFIGDMSLVGPRPNVKRETDLYTSEEQRLLDVRPGITDMASIVFSDENDILKDSEDPDLDYNRLIRPWKSRLGILYVEKATLILDAKLVFLTVLAILNRERALSGVQSILERLGADAELCRISRREEELQPHPPPGSTEIISSRE